MDSSSPQTYTELLNRIVSLEEKVDSLEKMVSSLLGRTLENVPEKAVPSKDDPIDLDFVEVAEAAAVALVKDAPETAPEETPVDLEQKEDVPPTPVLEEPMPETVPESSEAPVAENEEVVVLEEEPVEAEKAEPAPEAAAEEESAPMEPLEDLPFDVKEDLPADDAAAVVEEVEEVAAPVEIEDLPMDEAATVGEDEPEDLPAPDMEEAVQNVEDLPMDNPPAEEEVPEALFEGFKPAEPKKRGRPRKEVRSINDAESEAVKKSLAEVLANKVAWRTDRPGPVVKDIRSGIALIDRVVFINTLFGKDASLYQETITKMNSCKDLDEAVDYLSDRFPDWNLASDEVYRFMMAVRRKLR